MKRHSIPFFLILASVFVSALSCKKGNPTEPKVQFPLSVSAKELVSKDPVRLFTREGEVTDADVIAQFITGTNGFNDGFEIDPNDIITFHTDSTAEFKSLTKDLKIRVETTGKLVFRFPFVPSPEYAYAVALQPLLDHHRIAKTNTLDIIPTSTGIGYLGEVVIVASGTYRKFELPATVYLLSRWRGQGEAAASYYRHSGVFSPFNEQFLETLGPRDTVAYQTGVIRFVASADH